MSVPTFDRLKSGLAAFISAVLPRVDYLSLYPGTIVQQRGPNSFDFQPDSQAVPGMAAIPIYNPTPGVTFQVDATKSPRALLGFKGGDPAQPVILLWEVAGLQSWTLNAGQAVTLVGSQVNLGASSPSDAVALASKVLSQLNSIQSAFNSHVHTSGGSGSQTTTPTVPMGAPSSVASTVVLSA